MGRSWGGKRNRLKDTAAMNYNHQSMVLLLPDLINHKRVMILGRHVRANGNVTLVSGWFRIAMIETV